MEQALMKKETTPRILNMRIPAHRRLVQLGKAKRCDRATKYGNPFIIGKDGNRAQVIAKHKAWLDANFTDADFEELRGWDLACWCWPEPCHCEELRRRANKPGA